jgi:outer membrane protein assembly factor BamB
MRFWPVRLALLVVLVLVAAGCDWTMFGYGPAHTRSNPTEKTIGVGNAGLLTTAWTGTTFGEVESSPAVANGVVYVGANDGSLYAFDAAGSRGCSGTPATCAPLWTAATGGFVYSSVFSSPAVANGVVYVGSNDNKLYAFDAAGSRGCSGTPKTCAPLWTGTTGGTVESSPAVANGIVYVGSADHKLYAFDAAGSTGCSGTPKTCAPLWSGTTGGTVGSSPAVANGVVYVGSFEDGKLNAFDAAGSTGCSGTPKTCTPLWTGATAGDVESSPAVANGIVYVGSTDGRLYAFGAAGSTGCSGAPKTCAPLWTAIPEESGGEILSSPAVANGIVYFGSTDHDLYAFDATGSNGCSGTPKTCTVPLWFADTGGSIFSSPSVANGVVYVGSGDGKLDAFDAAGSVGCLGMFPSSCAPLWSGITAGAIFSSPAVANGVLYVGSNDTSLLYAFKPPHS